MRHESVKQFVLLFFPIKNKVKIPSVSPYQNRQKTPHNGEIFCKKDRKVLIINTLTAQHNTLNNQVVGLTAYKNPASYQLITNLAGSWV